MTEWMPLFVAVIMSLPAWLAWISSRRNSKAIQDIHISINSRMDDLLKAARGEATEIGHAAGLKEGKISSKPDPIPGENPLWLKQPH